MRRIGLRGYLATTLKFKAEAALTHANVAAAVGAAAEAAELASQSGQAELAHECAELERRARRLQSEATQPGSGHAATQGTDPSHDP